MQYHILVAFIALRVIFLRIKGYPVVSFTTHGYPRGSRCSIRLEKSLNRRLRRPRPTVPAYTAGNPPQIMFHLDFTSIYSIYIYIHTYNYITLWLFIKHNYHYHHQLEFVIVLFSHHHIVESLKQSRFPGQPRPRNPTPGGVSEPVVSLLVLRLYAARPKDAAADFRWLA